MSTGGGKSNPHSVPVITVFSQKNSKASTSHESGFVYHSLALTLGALWLCGSLLSLALHQGLTLPLPTGLLAPAKCSMQGPQAPDTISPADPLPLPALRNVSQQKATLIQLNTTSDNAITIWTFAFIETWVLAAFLRQQNDDPV